MLTRWFALVDEKISHVTSLIFPPFTQVLFRSSSLELDAVKAAHMGSEPSTATLLACHLSLLHQAPGSSAADMFVFVGWELVGGQGCSEMKVAYQRCPPVSLTWAE